MEISGFEPEASRMQSERSTPELYPPFTSSALGMNQVKPRGVNQTLPHLVSKPTVGTHDHEII